MNVCVGTIPLLEIAVILFSAHIPNFGWFVDASTLGMGMCATQNGNSP